MPPRFVYWTILAGGLPTAFRATEREELLPTFKRILEKHPDAEMKYFARGKLWASPEEAKAELKARPPRDGRGRDWRPGGEHRDPRQKFKDAKKDRNQRWRQEKHERRTQSGRLKPAPTGGTFEPGGPRKPHGDPLRKPAAPKRPPFNREGGPPAFTPRGERPFKPGGERPFRGKSDRPFKPGGDRPFRPKGDRPFKAGGERTFKPGGDRPFRPKSDRPVTPRGERAGTPAAPKRAPFNREGGRPRDGTPRRPPYKTRWERENEDKKKRGRS